MYETLVFMCPYCSRTMQVPAKYLGQRGRCNKCGGRVLLEGQADVAEAQPASPLDEEQPQELPLIETLEAEALRICWEALAPDGESPPRDAYSLRRGLWDYISEDEDGPEVSGATRSRLLRLGLDPGTVDGVATEAKANALHEELHLQPTVLQRRALQTVGASGAAVAAARTRAHARLLLENGLLSAGSVKR